MSTLALSLSGRLSRALSHGPAFQQASSMRKAPANDHAGIHPVAATVACNYKAHVRGRDFFKVGRIRYKIPYRIRRCRYFLRLCE